MKAPFPFTEIYSNEPTLNPFNPSHQQPLFQNSETITNLTNTSTMNLHNLTNFLKSNDKMNNLVQKYNNMILTFKEDLEATALFATAGTLDADYGIWR